MQNRVGGGVKGSGARGLPFSLRVFVRKGSVCVGDRELLSGLSCDDGDGEEHREEDKKEQGDMQGTPRTAIACSMDLHGENSEGYDVGTTEAQGEEKTDRGGKEAEGEKERTSKSGGRDENKRSTTSSNAQPTASEAETQADRLDGFVCLSWEEVFLFIPASSSQNGGKLGGKRKESEGKEGGEQHVPAPELLHTQLTVRDVSISSHG